MKILLKILLLTVVLLIAAAVVYLTHARPVVTGYAAKQMCSGLWVSRLPESWLREGAIAPALEPASAWLEYQIDTSQYRVTTSFLGFEQTALWRGYYTGNQDINKADDKESSKEDNKKRSINIPINMGCVLLDQYGSAVEQEGDGQTVISASETMSPSLAATEKAAKSPETTPEAINSLIEEAFRETGQTPRNTLALLVSHKGRLIAERYAEPVTQDTPMLGWSISKSLLPTWIAIQEQQEQRDINPSIADNWPWQSANMTLEHLLRMESGLAFREWYQPGDDVTAMLYQQGNMASWVANQTGGRPGVHWAYSSGDSNLASYEWTQQLNTHWRQWLMQNVWQPLGIRSAVVETDRMDTPVTSSYVHMTPQDWLKIGQLWLDGWHNRSDRLPPDWMKQATTPSDAHQAGLYGEGFWLNLGSDTQSSRWPALPTSVFWARGHDGQYVLVAPEQELVVVRFGLTPGDNDGISTLVAGLIDRLGQNE